MQCLEKFSTVGQLEAAMNLDGVDFAAKYGRDKPEDDDPVVVHCKSGRRSRTAAEKLTELGLTAVRTYKGSFDDWKGQGGRIAFPAKKKREL